MSKNEQQQSQTKTSSDSDLSHPKYLFEAVDAYHMMDEKDQLLSFLATWKDKDLTDQQAVEQLKLLTAAATEASDAHSAHQRQMELLQYADKVVEKVIDSNKASFENTFQFFHQQKSYS